MSPPTGKVFALLELLQAAPGATAAELAGRLSVDERTVRRYATHLCALGLPVQARRGRRGGFRLVPGFRLPPLILTNDEAVAVVLGLLGTIREQRADSASPGGASATALAKIMGVLPAGVALQVHTLITEPATAATWNADPASRSGPV